MWNKATIVIAVCCIALLGTSVSAFALGVGGLSYNIGPSFSLGAGVSFTQRDMYTIENDNLDDEMISSRFLVKGDVAPIRYLDVYGLIGMGDLQLDDGEFEGTLGTMWGAGIKPQLFPLTWQSPLNITLDAQYAELLTRDDDIDARMQEVQVALAFAYVMRSLTPYGGVKYDHLLVHFDGIDNDMITDMQWGAFIGCDYYVTPNVFFNLELSIFAETAFFISTGYKY
ncbi:MAG TPA: hypothetical protein PK961_05870 [bacterium]|nr:hypothetical protein [bacterium]